MFPYGRLPFLPSPLYLKHISFIGIDNGRVPMIPLSRGRGRIRQVDVPVDENGRAVLLHEPEKGLKAGMGQVFSVS